jgi:hypothetical protein
MSRPISTKTERELADWDEMMDLAGAAHYLKCSPRTLEDWILDRRFGAADGLRRVGDLIRIYMPVLRERVKQDRLMGSTIADANRRDRAPARATPKRAATAMPKCRNALVELYEALREGSDSAVPELPLEP